VVKSLTLESGSYDFSKSLQLQNTAYSIYNSTQLQYFCLRNLKRPGTDRTGLPVRATTLVGENYINYDGRGMGTALFPTEFLRRAQTDMLPINTRVAHSEKSTSLIRKPYGQDREPIHPSPVRTTVPTI
jgi:hypothetical protein